MNIDFDLLLSLVGAVLFMYTVGSATAGEGHRPPWRRLFAYWLVFSVAFYANMNSPEEAAAYRAAEAERVRQARIAREVERIVDESQHFWTDAEIRRLERDVARRDRATEVRIDQLRSEVQHREAEKRRRERPWLIGIVVVCATYFIYDFYRDRRVKSERQRRSR